MLSQNIIFQLKRKYLSGKILQIERQLSQAEKSSDEKNVAHLMDNFRKVLSEMNNLNK